MKALSKKLFALCGAVVLAVTSLQAPMEVQAASSATKVKNAYITYLKKQIANCAYGENIEYWLYDFNKDGTKELVIYDNKDAGAHGGSYDVYTYRSKNVVSLVKGVSEVGYIKGKKYIVPYSSGGAYDYDYTVYKMSKGKLKKVNKYACVRGIFKKDGKTITQSKFNTFSQKVITDLGTSKQIAKKYYTPKKLGISIQNSEKTYIHIDHVTNKKVYYYTYKLGNEGMTTSQSKIKSAKITSKTKFYYGDTQLLFSGTLKGDSFDTRKWIYSISKKQFIEKMENYYGSNDRIIIKNGKVEKVIIHIQVAG